MVWQETKYSINFLNVSGLAKKLGSLLIEVLVLAENTSGDFRQLLAVVWIRGEGKPGFADTFEAAAGRGFPQSGHQVAH